MAKVISVSRSSKHEFSKTPVDEILLVEGEGVSGDAHRGQTVKHRSRVRKGATLPNLRQVHLMHIELIKELQSAGFLVKAATMGENITTSGLDVLALPTGTILSLGAEAKLEVTGLRNPCFQLDQYQQGLMAAVLDKDEKGELIRKSGIMSIVLRGGVVRPGDEIVIEYPDEPHRPLSPV